MDDIVYYSELYDLYGGLLTSKQREYFEDYYFNNFSFSEMAENYRVSRNAVFRQIHIVMEKLDQYENILHLKKKREEIDLLLSDVGEDVRKKIDEILY